MKDIYPQEVREKAYNNNNDSNNNNIFQGLLSNKDENFKILKESNNNNSPNYTNNKSTKIKNQNQTNILKTNNQDTDNNIKTQILDHIFSVLLIILLLTIMCIYWVYMKPEVSIENTENSKNIHNNLISGRSNLNSNKLANTASEPINCEDLKLKRSIMMRDNNTRITIHNEKLEDFVKALEKVAF